MKTIGLVFSNIHDKSIKELAEFRTVASIPFGGRYKLIDLVLSGMVNSGVRTVGVVTKYNYQSLMEHVGSGKCWDLSRINGGLFFLPPFSFGNGVYSNRFEAVLGIKNFILSAAGDYVIMSDCDNICAIEFDKVVRYHVKKEADITLVCRETKLTKPDGKRRVVITADETGLIKTCRIDKNATNEFVDYINVMVIKKTLLLTLIEEAKERGGKSFSEDVICYNANKLKVYAYPFRKHFGNIDSITSYFEQSMRLLNKSVRDELFRSPTGGVYTRPNNGPPIKIGKTASLSNSLVAEGCIIEGTVINSVLSSGVHVLPGATVKDSILFDNCKIGEKSTVNCMIADQNATVLNGRTLSGHPSQPYYLKMNSRV